MQTFSHWYHKNVWNITDAVCMCVCVCACMCVYVCVCVCMHMCVCVSVGVSEDWQLKNFTVVAEMDINKWKDRTSYYRKTNKNITDKQQNLRQARLNWSLISLSTIFQSCHDDDVKKYTLKHVFPSKTQISLLICKLWSELLLAD